LSVQTNFLRVRHNRTVTAAALSRPALEIVDIFRRYGPAWRQATAGHVSLGELKVMSATENCRTAELGGHVCRWEVRLHTGRAGRRLWGITF
jgi:hypothetical protein